ncbi:MAG: hypothetical protein ABIL58_22745, partial [Pseudomonadota bacterium]
SALIHVICGSFSLQLLSGRRPIISEIREIRAKMFFAVAVRPKAAHLRHPRHLRLILFAVGFCF